MGADGDYRQFLSRHAPQAIIPGQIMDQQGNILGNHQGSGIFHHRSAEGIASRLSYPALCSGKGFSATHAIVVGPREQSGSDHLIAEGC